jgi:hypothetical protein
MRGLRIPWSVGWAAPTSVDVQMDSALIEGRSLQRRPQSATDKLNLCELSTENSRHKSTMTTSVSEHDLNSLEMKKSVPN